MSSRDLVLVIGSLGRTREEFQEVLCNHNEQVEASLKHMRQAQINYQKDVQNQGEVKHSIKRLSILIEDIEKAYNCPKNLIEEGGLTKWLEERRDE